MGFFDALKEKANAVASDAGRAGKVTAAQARAVVLQSDVRKAERELGHVAFDLIERGELEPLTFLDLDWQVVNRQLERERQTRRSGPAAESMLRDVGTVTLRFMDSTRTWQDQWPPLGMGGAAGTPSLGLRPMAVEIVIELKDIGRIVRLAEVPG